MLRPALALVAALAGCTPACPKPEATVAVPTSTAASSSAPAQAPAASFELSKAELRKRGASEDLVGKLARSRFRYFRMLAEPFELRTCEAFRDRSAELPIMAVHGDAHLEQFVVTDKTYGLEDFDRAGFGPIVVDLVRYAASLHVACSQVAWPCDGDAAVERFFAAYRDVIDRDAAPAPQPQVVERLRAEAPRTTAPWLAWAEGLMVPLEPAIEREVQRSWPSFERLMLDIHPEWAPTTLQIVRSGALSLGFGSALERKVLFRVAGATAAPDDDMIIEAREGTPPGVHGCVWRATYGESLILMFMAILGRRMPAIYGFVTLPGSPRRFWVQSWDPGYAELSIGDVESQAELDALVTDAAHQLGGHVWSKFPEPLRPQHRHTQLAAFDATRARAADLARELAVESNQAWERFRADPLP
jgi:hypothetical protein